MGVADRIMFEIYREADYARQYRIVYFTELNEHNKESEINRAMAGEHFADGFIMERSKERAKAALAEVVRRLNAGEKVDAAEVESRIATVEGEA